MSDVDIEKALPLPSSGKPQKKKQQSSKPVSKSSKKQGGRKKQPKYASAGGGKGTRRKKPPPPDNTKKFTLGAGLLLCFISLLAIILASTGNYGATYNTSMPQFMLEIQVEKVNEEFVTWNDEFSDLNSAKSKQLTSSLSLKLLKAFEDEAISVDDVVITEMKPTEPRTVTRMAEDIGFNTDNSLWSFRGRQTSQDKGKPTKTLRYPNMRFVSVKYETKGIPSKNAGIFSSAHGQWSTVSNMMESRMQMQGVKASIEELQPFDVFMDNVFEVIKENPSAAKVPSQMSPIEPCDCGLMGSQIASTKVCECSSGCVTPNAEIFGGYDNKFSAQTRVCVAAYYAGIISESGGVVEVLNLGRGNVEKGGMQRSLRPKNVAMETMLYKLKAPGPSGVQHAPPSFDDPGPSASLSSKENADFTMYIQFKTLDGQPVSYVGTMTSVGSTESQDMWTKIKPKITQAVTSHGFDATEIKVRQFIEPPSKTGLIVGIDVKGDLAKNAKVAVGLEEMDPGSIPSKIAFSLKSDDLVIRSFRYGRNFLEKMTELASS